MNGEPNLADWISAVATAIAAAGTSFAAYFAKVAAKESLKTIKAIAAKELKPILFMTNSVFEYSKSNVFDLDFSTVKCTNCDRGHFFNSYIACVSLDNKGGV
jgi:hypothetical protein